jgi:hypothetical protein
MYNTKHISNKGPESKPQPSVQLRVSGRDSTHAPSAQADSVRQLGGPSPLDELDQLVTAERLRVIIWDAASRPSMQWVRKETKRRMLPHIRRGRLIFYRPRSVIEWYAQRESRPTSMK